MKNIYYNSAVAKACGKNGIIKAVLLNYIYNYHKLNIRKKPGDPAQISLAEFVYQYNVDEKKGLWQRSFIHKILKDLKKDDLLNIEYKNKAPVYSVPPRITELLTAEDSVTVSFDLEMAIEHGIYLAIVYRYLMYVIDKSPEGQAYNLSVKAMSEINRISPAQIYREIKRLKGKVILRVRSKIKYSTRALSLIRINSGREIHNAL